MTITNRTLFFGDNLQVLGERVPDALFDLIYLDPPFNSNKNYNVLFKEGKVDSSAQIQAFEDTWEWTEPTVKLFKDLCANSNPNIALLINSLAEFVGQNAMMAYLVNMTARLIPLHRVLKDTGSIYLHCDPTASHYLKVIMDVIFGKENFRNEIVWCYSTSGRGKREFSKKHDIILFYSKTDDYFWNDTEAKVPYSQEYIQSHFKDRDDQGRVCRKRFDAGKWRTYYPEEGMIPNDWWEMPYVNSMAAERLGYPTQKPESLLDRIIHTSSKEGDWVLDPFCGCGTTVAVAEKLHRNWVGIDISMLAINVIAKRLKDHYQGLPVTIDGIPMDYESACKLAEKDKFSFQDWAISLIGAHPPSGETRKGADRGIDGLILFYERGENLRNPKLRKIVIQVKGGGTGRGDVAKLKGDIEREDAPMGVLMTLDDPTAEMKREAALAGMYQYSSAVSFPKIQLLSMKDWFDGRTVTLPTDKVNPFKRAEAKADQASLF